jgi:hypothetical protein
MNRLFLLSAAAILLAGCASDTGVNVTRDKAAPKVVTKSRSEPIFYNGKTYTLDYDYAAAAGAFDMRVSGMGPKQQKDAVAVATSSLGYFACPDGQKGHLTTTPRYEGGQWKMQARCA